jgi:hypothetical protein
MGRNEPCSTPKIKYLYASFMAALMEPKQARQGVLFFMCFAAIRQRFAVFALIAGMESAFGRKENANLNAW